MAHIARTALGEATTTRKWYIDLNTGTHGAPTWIGVNGVTDFTLKMEPVLKSDGDYNSAGWESQKKTGMKWSASLKCQRKVTVASAVVYDPGQEALRAAAKVLGSTSIKEVRFYEVTASGPIVEAYQGYCEVTWSPDGGEQTELEAVSIDLTGRGTLDSITHPDYAAAVPILYSVTPATAGAAGGSLHTLKGINFFAAGVDDVVSMAVGVTDIPTYITDDDQTVHFLMPAKVAGTWALTVTNATGVSTVTVNIVTS